MLSQQSEEERPGQTSRDQEMVRLQEARKTMHRMAAAAAATAVAAAAVVGPCSSLHLSQGATAADAAAVAAVVVGPCSSLHLSQGAAAADAGRLSFAQIHVLIAAAAPCRRRRYSMNSG